MRLTQLTLIALATFSVGTFALRAAETTPATGHRGEGLHKKLLEKFDTNGDGKLDETERAAAKTAMKERMGGKLKEKFDTDGDGTLNDTEKAAAKAALQKRHQEMLSKFDANGDGKMEPDERKAAREARKEHRKANKGKNV